MSIDNNNNEFRSNFLDLCFVNSKSLIKTWSSEWRKTDSIPKTVQEKLPSQNINYRYVLKPEFKDKGFFEYILEDNIYEKYTDGRYIYDDNDERMITLEFASIKSLYTKTWDIELEQWKNIDFEYTCILRVDLPELIDINTVLKFPTGKVRNINYYITYRDVTYPKLSQIIFPEILVPTVSDCTLSSEQVYSIVREHIKRNIDQNWAYISSDYDFCFVVEKYVRLHSIEYTKQEIKTSNGKSYKHPEYKEITVKKRSFRVFEMTYSPRNYEKYTSIQSITGSNIQDLEQKVKDLCDEIITVINEPLIECPNCQGYGITKLGKSEN